MTSLSESEVKELVKDHYAEVAKGANSCCDDSCCTTETKLYALEEVEGLPDEAVMASAGCGNPTAIGELNAGETVVDFGSGGGIDCFLAERAVGSEGKVIGVDMTPDMVNLARSNAKKLGLSNVEFHLTEMEHTPIPDASVDVIISNCVINLAPDKDAVFKEAFRILKPGGRVYISDMLLVSDMPDEARADMSNWVACLGGTEPKDVYLGRMGNAGFGDMEIIADKPWEGSQTWTSPVHSMNFKAFKPA
jgi:arsenite methyltransferase